MQGIPARDEPRRVPGAAADGWLMAQLRTAWHREGEPATSFRLARPVAVLCGVLVLVLLAVATVTVVNLDGLWRWHEAAGFVLLPVLAVKLGPVGARAVAYYARGLLRRRQPSEGGAITPPVLLARLTAPLLVADTALLLGSGVVMWHTGDQRSIWSTLHNGSAIAGAGLVAVHLACHARSTMAVGVRSLRPRGDRVTGGRLAPAAVAASLVAGIVLAAFTVPGASWRPGRPDRFRERPFAPPAVALPGAPAAHVATSASR